MSDQKPKTTKELFEAHYAEQDRLEAEAKATKGKAGEAAAAELAAEAAQLALVGKRPGLGILFRPKEPPQDPPAE
jgi:hypothetical protein